MPSLNIGYGGEDSSGIYHSVYDDFYFYTHFLDTDSSTAARWRRPSGTAVIRLADADLLPFRFTNLADTVQHLRSRSCSSCVKTRRDEISERNREIADGVFAAIERPARAAACAPKPGAVPPALDFAPLVERGRNARGRAAALDEARSAAAERRRRPAALAAIDASEWRCSEQQLLDTAGLAAPRMVQHLLYAPGFYTGYGVKTMPGVREAIEQGQVRQGAGGNGSRGAGDRA